MSKRVFAVLALCLLVFLAACESKTTGKRVAIPETSSKAPKTQMTGSAVVETPAPADETGKTAAELLKELQNNPTPTTDSSSKSGTFYPPVITDATGKDALKVKTDALMKQSTPVPTSVKADTSSGAKYHDSSGNPDNLPSEYQDHN